MKKVYEVNNVKCSGCANTLITALKNDFGEVSVDLEVNPRKITLNIDDSKEAALKIKLKELGYPLTSEQLSTFENVTTSAKSFVSCAIGKVNLATSKK